MDRTDIAPDGGPVAFYRRLPAQGEPELIHAVIGPDTSVLDLAAGGRTYWGGANRHRIGGPGWMFGRPSRRRVPMLR